MATDQTTQMKQITNRRYVTEIDSKNIENLNRLISSQNFKMDYMLFTFGATNHNYTASHGKQKDHSEWPNHTSP